MSSMSRPGRGRAEAASAARDARMRDQSVAAETSPRPGDASSNTSAPASTCCFRFTPCPYHKLRARTLMRELAYGFERKGVPTRNVVGERHDDAPSRILRVLEPLRQDLEEQEVGRGLQVVGHQQQRAIKELEGEKRRARHAR